MEFIIIFKNSILPLFIIVALAAFYSRTMKPNINQLANLTLMVFAPIFVFDSLVNHDITLALLIKPMLFMALLTGALMALAYMAAKMIKAGQNERVPLILAVSMINVGNFGLPLIYFVFDRGAEVHSILYFTAFNIPLTTIAIYISSPEKRLIPILVDIAGIPLFHAVIIALIVAGLSINMPAALDKSLSLMAQAAIPLLIFILGLQLAHLRIKTGYIKIIILAVVLRLIISPVIAYLCLKLIGVTGLEGKVALVQTSTPSALLPLMYAIRFNRSPDLLAAIILATTLLSSISLTILIKLIT